MNSIQLPNGDILKLVPRKDGLGFNIVRMTSEYEERFGKMATNTEVDLFRLVEALQCKSLTHLTNS